MTTGFACILATEYIVFGDKTQNVHRIALHNRNVFVVPHARPVAPNALAYFIAYYGTLDLRHLAVDLLPNELLSCVMPLRCLDIWNERHGSLAVLWSRLQAFSDQCLVELAQLYQIVRI